jgi:amidase
MSNRLHFLELCELARLLRERRISSVEATEAQLARIAAIDPELNSYSVVLADDALAAARSADIEIASGRYRGALHGVPVGIKDLCWMKDVPTAAGTSIFRDYRPAVDASVVTRLHEAGAIILGKLQMTEGAYADHHPSVTPPKNPWNRAYWPGISSSGSAVATAAGLCYGSLGSDTGGSIRWPCGANGLSGLKPTWGRVSRFGIFDLAPSMDHIGPIARSVADAAIIFDMIGGEDANDPTSLRAPRPCSLARLDEDLTGLRLGIDESWNDEDVDEEVRLALRHAIDVFRDNGVRLVHVIVPDTGRCFADWLTACAVEAAIAHEQTYPSRSSEYGHVLASVLETGRSTTAIDYQKTQVRRIELRSGFERLFSEIDILLVPVQPSAALTLEKVSTFGQQPELVRRLQQYTAPFDITGHPTLTLPAGFTAQRLPIGMQFVAGHLQDEMLLKAGVAFQRLTSWHRQHPPI